MSPLPPGGAPRKESIFSSLAPAPAPAPAPASMPSPRASVDPEAVNALKTKIDALEKNIVSQLEKKMVEQFKTAASAAPAGAAAPARAQESDLLYGKIEALERRLADFGQAAALSASLSASQLKNIEESKISARREIEDLLKAVREQQKYSELDRQMHEQLEHAWTRAEELEKKLMDFYSSILAMETRRRDDAAAASEKSAAAGDKAAASVDALAARLAGLEEKLGALLARSPEEEQRRAREEFFAAMSKERLESQASRLSFYERVERESQAARMAQEAFFAKAAQERAAAAEEQKVFFAKAAEEQKTFFAKAAEERRAQDAAQQAAREAAVREMAAGVKETAGSFKEIFDNYVRGEFQLFREKVSGEVDLLRRELSASAEDSRKFLREQASLISEKNADVARMLDENRLKADGVEASLGAAARRQALALEEFSRRLESELRAMNSDYAAAVKRESDERFAKFGAKYADALVSATFVEGFRAAVADSLERIRVHQETLSAFIASVPPGQMEKSMGVSGDIARKNFYALAAAAKELASDMERLREIKAGIEHSFKDIFGER